MAISVKVSDWLLERRQRIMYLVINWDIKQLGRQVRVKPEADFNAVISKYVTRYVDDGKMPPADIAPAILNLADDYIAGREVSIRAGDYITIQNHIRSSAKRG